MNQLPHGAGSGGSCLQNLRGRAIDVGVAAAVAGTVTTTEWSDCGGGVYVQLVAIAGLGPTWPRRSDDDATAHVLAFRGLGG